MDIEQSYHWLKYGDIKGETESTIVAAQDQAISTNYFKNKIFKKEIESKCRFSSCLTSKLYGRADSASASTNNRFLCRSTTQAPCSIVRA